MVTIHDCIAVLPNDMDDAHERIRRAMIHICQGDPLAKLADGLKVTPDDLPRLKLREGELKWIKSADKILNY